MKSINNKVIYFIIIQALLSFLFKISNIVIINLRYN